MQVFYGDNVPYVPFGAPTVHYESGRVTLEIGHGTYVLVKNPSVNDFFKFIRPISWLRSDVMFLIFGTSDFVRDLSVRGLP